jgi:hypothetical protein
MQASDSIATGYSTNTENYTRGNRISEAFTGGLSDHQGGDLALLFISPGK